MASAASTSIESLAGMSQPDPPFVCAENDSVLMLQPPWPPSTANPDEACPASRVMAVTCTGNGLELVIVVATSAEAPGNRASDGEPGVSARLTALGAEA